MELIRGSDLKMERVSASDAASPILSSGDTAKQTMEDYRMRLDAIISLLIEKKLISREEIVSMIYQKKMGI
jgi:hypothetical protein